MPLRRPPALLLGLALLSAGALTQTLVAWTCSYLDQRDAIMGKSNATRSRWTGVVPPHEATKIKVHRTERFGTATVYGSWPYERPPEHFSTFDPLQLAQPFAALLTTIRPFNLSQLLTKLEGDNRNSTIRYYSFAGWPWLSMCRIDGHTPTSLHAKVPKSEGVLRLDVGLNAPSTPTHLLLPANVAPRAFSNGTLIPINSWPVGVIWPNFLANTAVYSAAWLLLAAPIPIAHHLRNRARCRNHLCPTCGYDWSTTTGPCPECNTTRPTTTATPPPPTLPPQ